MNNKKLEHKRSNKPMKVIILKQALKGLELFKTSNNEYLNLYGKIRDKERVINIVSIGLTHPYIEPIGQVYKYQKNPEGKYLLVYPKEKGIECFYYQNEKWEKAKTKIIDLNNIYKRTPFTKHLLRKLWHSLLIVFGLGSGGSRLSLDLARAGVGKFKLADPDRFTITNCSRHECGLEDLGRYKVDAVKEKILDINPLIEVKTYHSDLFKASNKKLDESFSNVDLVIGLTDKTSIQLAINSESWKRRIPALFAGCYEEARGGEVFYTLPEQLTPCLECLRGGFKQPEQGNIDYSQARDEQDYEGEPGLYCSISLVTVVAEQFALALLLRKEDCKLSKIINPRKNYLLIGGALAKDFYLFKRAFQFIPISFKGPRRDCECCQKKETSKELKAKFDKEIKNYKQVPTYLRQFIE